MKSVLEYVVLSVLPATSIPRKKLRQIASAQHDTSALMQAFVVVVHLKTDTRKNQLLDVNKI